MKPLLNTFHFNGHTKQTSKQTSLLYTQVLRFSADNFPPTFDDTCPTSPLIVYAERGLFTAKVNWTEPVATDNLIATPSVTSNYRPPQRFTQGTHVITYTATDQSGNEATCTFAIKVIGRNCTFVVEGFFFRFHNVARHTK